jgi:protocatechuate 3,4-dioxygenase beta subunit
MKRNWIKEVAKMNKKISLVLLLAVIALAGVPQASALPTYKIWFEANYSAAVNSRIDACLLCHVDPDPFSSGNTDRNPYGADFGRNGHNFTAIEPLDSDGDGFINIDEIHNLTFPGNASDHPVTPTPVTFNISGFKINDTNGNGVWDAGEMGIENWNIKLLNDTGVKLANTSTNASGFYQFMNIFPGKYNVTEEMKDGFTPTNATTKAIIVENMDVMNVNFTNQATVTPQQTFTISGFKINDTNGNGVWDAGEMGIENWNIKLLNDTGVKLANTSTNAQGFYQFMKIFPGNYNIAEETRAGFTPTNATSMPVTVENMDVMNVNFTNQVTVIPTPTPTPPPQGTFTISGFKVNDTNGNNMWDSGEMGIENWNIRLLNATTGTQIASTSTNASGFYEFMNLAPGVYNVTEEINAGFTPSGATFKVVTIENMDITDVDFLNHVTVPPAVKNIISGFKINDLNGNGKQDAGEEGLPGWNIKLIGIVPETVGINKETTTGDNGFYSFEDLPAGMYLLVETLKGDYVPSGPPVLVVNLENGKNSMNNNFMNRPISSLIPDLSGLFK